MARGFDPRRMTRAPAAGPGAGGFGAVGGRRTPVLDRSRRPSVQADRQRPGRPRFRPWSEPAPAGPGPMRCQFLRSVGPDGRLTDAQKTAVPDASLRGVRRPAAAVAAAAGAGLSPAGSRQLPALRPRHAPRQRDRSLRPRRGRSGRAGVPLLTLVGIGLVILAIGTCSPASWGCRRSGAGSPATPSDRLAVRPDRRHRRPRRVHRHSVRPGPASARRHGRATPDPDRPRTPTADRRRLEPTASLASGRDRLADEPAGALHRPGQLLRLHGQGPRPAPAGNGSAVADTLAGVARYFGVSLAAIQADESVARRSANVHPGDKLKIPPPTR